MSDCVWCKCDDLRTEHVITETPQRINSQVVIPFTPKEGGGKTTVQKNVNFVYIMDTSFSRTDIIDTSNPISPKLTKAMNSLNKFVGETDPQKVKFYAESYDIKYKEHNDKIFTTNRGLTSDEAWAGKVRTSKQEADNPDEVGRNYAGRIKEIVDKMKAKYPDAMNIVVTEGDFDDYGNTEGTIADKFFTPPTRQAFKDLGVKVIAINDDNFEPNRTQFDSPRTLTAIEKDWFYEISTTKTNGDHIDIYETLKEIFQEVVQTETANETNFSIIVNNPEISVTSVKILTPDNEEVDMGNRLSFKRELVPLEHRLIIDYSGTPLNETIIKTVITSGNEEIKNSSRLVRPNIKRSDNSGYGIDTCDKLKQENDQKIKEFAIVYRDLQTCNLAEYGAKGFYNIWCLMNNLIGYICSLNKPQEIPKPKPIRAGNGITVSETADGITITNSKQDKAVVAGNGIHVSLDGNSYIVSSDVTVPKIKAGNGIQVSTEGGNTTISASPQTVDLSGYVPKADHDKLKATLNKIIENLEASGAWSGGLDGGFNSNRNIATGNINIFGGTPDGDSFIRTNNGRTENDLAGGI